MYLFHDEEIQYHHFATIQQDLLVFIDIGSHIISYNMCTYLACNIEVFLCVD